MFTLRTIQASAMLLFALLIATLALPVQTASANTPSINLERALGFQFKTTQLNDIKNELNRLPSDLNTCIVNHLKSKGVTTLYSKILTHSQRKALTQSFGTTTATCGDHIIQLKATSKTNNGGTLEIVWDVLYDIWDIFCREITCPDGSTCGCEDSDKRTCPPECLGLGPEAECYWMWCHGGSGGTISYFATCGCPDSDYSSCADCPTDDECSEDRCPLPEADGSYSYCGCPHNDYADCNDCPSLDDPDTPAEDVGAEG